MTDTRLSADYVVVGSGAGGGPLALRLAEAGHSVILIEAGEDSSNLAYSVPAFHAYASEDPATSWAFFVRHYADDEQQRRDQKYDAERDGVFYPRAGTVGGCTAHHAMIIVRPNDSDWDAIADYTGDTSWSAAQMSRYFERLEHCGYRHEAARPPANPVLARLLRWLPFARDRFEQSGHGFEGWLPTTMASPELLATDWQLVHAVADAAETELAQTLGRTLTSHEPLTALEDPNDARAQLGSMLGVWLIPLAVGEGRRAGTREALQRGVATTEGRLQLLTSTLATRLIIDDDLRCVGVECSSGARLYGATPPDGSPLAEPTPLEVFAEREVIVSGGAFNSPQLLKLSGIGPADELTALGIDVRVDLPGVGANLQDRYEVGVVTEVSRDFSLLTGGAFHPPQPDEPPDPYLAEWEEGRGAYTTNGAVLAVLAKSRPQLPVPDLFLFALPAEFHGYYSGYAPDLERRKDKLTWAILKAHTENRGGTVRLRSTDPCDVPQIDFHYFEEGTDTDGTDLDAVVAGVTLARRITARLDDDGAVETRPGPEVDSDEELRAWVRDNAWGHHACGTCAIGPDGEPSAVLDSRFRVRGVTGLRVVDASVFPRIPGYFIVTPTFMVSEKAADVILADSVPPTTIAPTTNPPTTAPRTR